MIFAITIISVLAFALINIFAKKTWQTFLSIIFAGIFLISLGFITANDHYHYGMKKVTETTTQTLPTEEKPYNRLPKPIVDKRADSMSILGLDN